MAEVTSLTRDVSDKVRVMPFEDYEGEFPEYKNSEGKWVRDDEGWREFGFVAPYPTGSILNRLKKLKTEIQFIDGAANLDSKDPKSLGRFLVNSIFGEVIGIEENGKPIDWNGKDKRWKNWMETELRKSSFLQDSCIAAYEEIAGKFKKAEKKEDEDFFDSPKPTIADNSKESDSQLSPVTIEPTA